MKMRDAAKTASLGNTSRLLLVIAALFGGLIMTVHSAKAGDDLDQGLKVGQTIPLSMSAPDQNGDTHSLKALMGRSGLILLFTRSLDW
jgi:hypothetical protein